ncbi:hypothetical protein [Thermophilibacter mediterraneus]|uniref:hypothetical protein n=1 Tax=Thermophilibacter mediterraneus TaxID=1871031 RepID=UPI0023527730|nr:hypothetical protein [Thermophilibacter mediterraneus]
MGMDGHGSGVAKSAIKYLFVSLCCWVFGSLVCEGCHEMGAGVPAPLAGDLPQCILRPALAWAVTLPAIIPCCVVMHKRGGLIPSVKDTESGSGGAQTSGKPSSGDKNAESENVRNGRRVGPPCVLALAISAVFYLTLLQVTKPLVPDVSRRLMAEFAALYAIVYCGIAVPSARDYSDSSFVERHSGSIRFLVAWPTLILHGMSLIGGCAVQAVYQYGLGLEGQLLEPAPLLLPAVYPMSVVYLALLEVAAIAYYCSFQSRDSGFDSQNGGEETIFLVPKSQVLIPMAIFLICSYLCRPECLFALLAAALFATFELAYVTGLCLERESGEHEVLANRCEATGNIARVVLLLAAMLVYCISFGKYDPSPGFLAGTKTYEIMVAAGLVVISGYVCASRIDSLRLSPNHDQSRSEPNSRILAALSANQHILCVPVVATIVLVPFLYEGGVSALRLMPGDATYLTAFLGAFGCVAGLFSVSFPPEEEGAGNGNGGSPATRNVLSMLIEPLRKAATARVRSYRCIQSYLPEGATGEGGSDTSRSYTRTLRDMLILCVLIGLVAGAMFSELGPFFCCFSEYCA